MPAVDGEDRVMFGAKMGTCFVNFYLAMDGMKRKADVRHAV